MLVINKIPTMKKLFIIFLIAVIHSGCFSLYNGNMYNNTVINQGNFKYTGVRSGSASCFYVFGIGGMNHSALINEAKERMLQEFPLRRNEALVNQIVEWKSSYYFPFFMRVTCIINAEVIQFDETDLERSKDE